MAVDRKTGMEGIPYWFARCDDCGAAIATDYSLMEAKRKLRKHAEAVCEGSP